MKNFSRSAGLVAAIVSLVCAGSVFAQYSEVDLSTYVNDNLNAPPYFDNGDFPSGGTTLTVAGVPFGLASYGGGTSLGVVQSPNSGAITLTSPTAYSFTIAVPAGTEATALYSLANSTYGQAGTLLGSITVTGTGGETGVLNLAEDNNIRDYNNGIWEDTLTNTSVVSTYFGGGAARLDMQVLDLPPTFDGDTIASITFAGTAYGDYNGEGPGSAFIAGLTFEDADSPSVPDGSLPLPLIAGMFLAMFGAGRIAPKQLRLKNISKSAGLVTAIVSLVCAGSANADTVTAVIGGGAQSTVNTVTFDGLAGEQTSPIVSGGLTITFNGNAATQSPTANNATSPPWLSGNNNVGFETPSTLPAAGEADTTTWISAGSTDGAGSATFNFTSAENYFGLVWGSIDTGSGNENVLKFYSGPNGTGSVVDTVTGTELVATNSAIDINPYTTSFDSGYQGESGTAYVNIYTSTPFESIVATSGHYTFEMDNIAYGDINGVPDGGMTVALLGGALVGLQALRRKVN